MSAAALPLRRRLTSPFIEGIDGTNADAVDGLLALHFPDAVTVLDMTYGNGKFWHPRMPRGLELTTLDIDPSRQPDVVADFTTLPFERGAFDVTVFDPPYMTNTAPGSIMGRRFGSFKSIPALELAVRHGCREAARVGRLGMLIKVKNQTHGDRLLRMTAWVEAELGPHYDELIYVPRGKPEDPKWGPQRSVRKRYSYYLVFRHDGPTYRPRARRGGAA